MEGNLTLLDRALILAQHELEALRDGDVDTACDHFDQRSLLMDEAITRIDEQNADDFKVKLIAIQSYNQMIWEEGQSLRAKIRDDLLRSRETMRQAKGYARTKLMQ